MSRFDSTLKWICDELIVASHFSIQLITVRILLRDRTNFFCSISLCLRVVSGIFSLHESIMEVVNSLSRFSGMPMALIKSKIKPSFFDLNSLSFLYSSVSLRIQLWYSVRPRRSLDNLHPNILMRFTLSPCALKCETWC